MHKIYLSGSELIKKIMVQGERNFAGISIPDGFEICGDEGKALAQYLWENHNQYHNDPLDFRGASLRHLTARNLYLPWVMAVGTDFTGARLAGCSLTYAHLERAIFREANLSPAPSGNPSGCKITSFARSELLGADFEKATLQETCFEYADLSKANFTSSYLHSADFTRATLCQVQGLESAIDLEHAKIEDITVTEKERKIILSSRHKKLFKKIIDSHLN